MISAQNASSGFASNMAVRKESTIFNIPIGRLGFISRLMIGGACGFLAFFVTFFFAIIGVSIYDNAHGISLANLNIAYLYIAAPVGILVMAASLTYLITGWLRRKISGGK